MYQSIAILNVSEDMHGEHQIDHIKAYICHLTGSSLIQAMDCRLCGTKPLPEPMLTYCQLDVRYKLQGNLNRNIQVSFKKMYLKYHLQNSVNFVLASMF